VKFFERIESPQEFLSRGIFTMPDKIIETTNEECPEQHDGKTEDKSKEDTEDEKNDDSSEDTQVYEQEDNEQQHTRGPGRPKIIRTGRPGRPRKAYHRSDEYYSEPKSVPQMLKQDDEEE